MQMMYENYRFMFIPIIVGVLGHVPECLFTNIQNLGFTKNETKKLAKKLQVLSVTRIVKICKKFMSFQVWVSTILIYNLILASQLCHLLRELVYSSFFFIYWFYFFEPLKTLEC